MWRWELVKFLARVFLLLYNFYGFSFLSQVP